MDGSHALLEAMKREGVEVIFGLPGGANMPIYDAMLDFGIRHVLVRHEQSAAHMAEGYARVTGKPGVCMATSGPGATNLVTGIADAYLDSVPMVAITGQVPVSMIGKDAFQETDIIGITTPITKYNFQPKTAVEIPTVVKNAFFIASTGRPGPVVIDIPKDAQTGVADMEFPTSVKVRGYNPNVDPDPAQIEKAADLLASAERPFIIAGGGVKNARAYEELQAVAEALMCPVATTFMGKGCFSELHPLSLYSLGMHGRAANKLVLEADAIFVVGGRFSDGSVGRPGTFGGDAKIIHVDIDESEMGKNQRVDVPIVSDSKKALAAVHRALQRRVKEGRTQPWLERVNMMKEMYERKIEDGNGNSEMKPHKIMKVLRDVLPFDTIVTTEVGQHQMWANQFFRIVKPGTFFSSGGLGTMGFGFPAALGAKVGRPDVPVVDIAGDGSFVMVDNSLAASVTENIPVIVVIINNKMLGMVGQWQRLFFKGRYSGVDMGEVPDFVKLAEAYGAEGRRAQSLAELSSAAREAVGNEVTTVIDVPISPEEDVLPMIPPGGAIKDMVE